MNEKPSPISRLFALCAALLMASFIMAGDSIAASKKSAAPKGGATMTDQGGVRGPKGPPPTAATKQGKKPGKKTDDKQTKCAKQVTNCAVGVCGAYPSGSQGQDLCVRTCMQIQDKCLKQ
jgi:hypothetical protein